jgi:hypothetical protein
MLARTLAESLDQAIDYANFRIAIDSKENKFVERRAVVQFQITPDHYDWFFNARTGYRAQYWIDPAVGTAFNMRIVELLAEVLTFRLPPLITARRVEVLTISGSRQERDTGSIDIARNEIAKSLRPDASKIWLGERLYSLSGGPKKEESQHVQALAGWLCELSQTDKQNNAQLERDLVGYGS